MKSTSLLKKILPYILISLLFFGYLFLKHQDIFKYKFNPSLVSEYLRSQDIEDTNNVIKDRVFLSDSDLYIASGYLYAIGNDPTKYNFQHPPLMKYLFGFSSRFLGNPFYVQIFFGLVLLLLTYFLGLKIFRSIWISSIGTLLLLIDPVFSNMTREVLLDSGQAVFALSYIILSFFYPGSYILQGVFLGLFAASKFWSTAVIIAILIFGYKILLKKEKINFKKILASFVIASLVFSATYIVSFIKAGGLFNIFLYEGRVIKFMLSHNSAGLPGGSIFLFLSGFFAPWWQGGLSRSDVWSVFWPISFFTSLGLALKTKIKEIRFFFYLLPIAYIILTATQVPFTRYFIIILPYAYLNLSYLLAEFFRLRRFTS